MKGIGDAGFLVAFARQNDAHHDWAVNLAARVAEPLLTCEPVVAGTAIYLESVSLALQIITEGLVAVAFASTSASIGGTRGKRFR